MLLLGGKEALASGRVHWRLERAGRDFGQSAKDRCAELFLVLVLSLYFHILLASAAGIETATEYIHVLQLAPRVLLRRT